MDLPSARRPLRVAHLIQYFEIGGLERMVERLCVASMRRGVESLVIAYLSDGPIRISLERQGVQTLSLSQGPGLHPRLILTLRSILRRERVDVLHTHHLGPFVYGAPAALLAGCPRVHTEHSHELYDVPRRRWLGAAMSRLAEVVAVSSEVSDYRKRFPGTCRLIPNGVPVPSEDPALRSQGRAMLGVDDSQFVIGCAARLSKEKDHAGLLEAFARLAHEAPHAILACAGDGPLRSELEARAERVGVGERIRWLGALEHMEPFYAALDLCVLNSQREGLPLSLLEAMAHGVPTVATDVGGVGALLEKDAGVLVRPGDPTHLAAELKALMADPAGAKRLGARGKDRVLEEYSLERMVDRYVALYRQVVRRRLPPADVESAPCT